MSCTSGARGVRVVALACGSGGGRVVQGAARGYAGEPEESRASRVREGHGEEEAMSDEYDFTGLKMNTVTEIRKERGVDFVLRENGAGADKALDQLAEEMAALQVERVCFERSLVRHFDRVGSYLGLLLGPLLLILLYLDRFERVRLALTSALLISLLVDIHVGRVRLKQEAREAAILDRFRFFQSIVRTVPIQNGEKP
jgi:hypothetical protein